MSFSWILDGEIGGMAAPSPDDLADLARAGVRLVVSLTRAPLSEPLLREFGLEGAHFPIEDFHAPSREQVDAFLKLALTATHSDRPVAVHCAAGIGRTGTMLACYLVARGLHPEDAVNFVRRRRPGSIETGEQEGAVYALAERIRGSSDPGATP